MKKKGNQALLRDPNLTKNRIFIGSLPNCTNEEVESICAPYGKVLGSIIQKKFAFVQFESEENAQKAANALNKSIFKGIGITSSVAKNKEPPPPMGQNKPFNNSSVNPMNQGSGEPMSSQTMDSMEPSSDANNGLINDCEIIVIDRKNTKYAEYIEERLKRLNLKVDVLFPNADVSLGKVLSSISSRGVFYAVLVTNQHEELKSITVNILYGQPAEHRNMPLEDAIKLIADDFRRKKGIPNMPIPPISNVPTFAPTLPNPVPIIAAATVLPPSINNRHPEAITQLLNLLINNMPLTALQYDRLIKYLNEKKEIQLKVELGDFASEKQAVPDPEIEMQKKIKDIMNKPSVAESTHRLFYDNLMAVKDDAQIMKLLLDIKVQNALDSLLSSNLVTTIETAMKF